MRYLDIYDIRYPTYARSTVGIYCISSVIKQIIFHPKQSQRSRSILKDGSRSLGLFRKGKIGIIAKFHRTDLVICSHSRGTKPPSYSQINMVAIIHSLKAQRLFLYRGGLTMLYLLPGNKE